MACPGPNINGEWFCDGLGCDVGGIHMTCKKAKKMKDILLYIHDVLRYLFKSMRDRELFAWRG